MPFEAQLELWCMIHVVPDMNQARTISHIQPHSTCVLGQPPDYHTHTAHLVPPHTTSQRITWSLSPNSCSLFPHADDLAQSLLDGRFESQKENMIRWKEKWKTFGIDATLKYLVEGDPRTFVAKCADGCGGVLQCGWPTAARLEVGQLSRSFSYSTLPLLICPPSPRKQHNEVAPMPIEGI